VYAAKEAGANAVKLQTFQPEDMTLDCDDEHFQIKEGLWKGQTYFELYKKIYMPWGWQTILKRIADQIGITLFSTPFSLEAVDFLEEEIGPSAYKVASQEMCWGELLDKVAATGKPVFLSTGCAENYREISQAVRRIGKKRCVPLYCASAYPARPNEIGLITIPTLSQMLGVHAGISDHSKGIAIATAAVASSARVVEKHLKLDEKSPDAAFALYPEEFKEMVSAIRQVEKAMYGVHFDGVNNNGFQYRRSIYAVKEFQKGDKISAEGLRVLRPNVGLSPNKIQQVIGKIAKEDIKAGTPLSNELVS
jgi:sialic acid synthase SpsE